MRTLEVRTQADMDGWWGGGSGWVVGARGGEGEWGGMPPVWDEGGKVWVFAS